MESPKAYTTAIHDTYTNEQGDCRGMKWGLGGRELTWERYPCVRM